MIAYGDADAMVAGGAESQYPLGVGGFGAARALSTRNDNPQAASRPGTKTVTVSCWAMVQVCSFWKSTNMRKTWRENLC